MVSASVPSRAGSGLRTAPDGRPEGRHRRLHDVGERLGAHVAGPAVADAVDGGEGRGVHRAPPVLVVAEAHGGTALVVDLDDEVPIELGAVEQIGNRLPELAGIGGEVDQQRDGRPGRADPARQVPARREQRGGGRDRTRRRRGWHCMVSGPRASRKRNSRSAGTGRLGSKSSARGSSRTVRP